MKKLLVEFLPQLAIHDMQRWGVLSDSHWSSQYRQGFNDPFETISVENKGLHFNIRVYGHRRYIEIIRVIESRPKFVEIKLDTTDANFGNVRYWLVCPECTKRYRDLYFTNYKWMCRKCGNIAYASQSLSYVNDPEHLAVIDKALYELWEELWSSQRFFYKGHPTKKYLRYLERLLDVYPELYPSIDFHQLSVQHNPELFKPPHTYISR